MDLAPEGSRYMQKTVSWLELARIPRSVRDWLEVFGVIEPQFLNLLQCVFACGRKIRKPDGCVPSVISWVGGWKQNFPVSLFVALLAADSLQPASPGVVFGRRKHMRSSRDWLSIYFKDVLPWA